MTNNYYNKNAKKFFNNTVNVDMTPNYKDFLNKVKKQGHILDAGCGSGRDTYMFKKYGYKVTAIDASSEMCKLASNYLKEKVTCLKFQDIDYINEFDGIWASSSLLHVNSKELPIVLNKLKTALKENGILYASFKYGNFEGTRNERYFTDLNEESAKELFSDFELIKIWITNDARKGREDEKWLNILVKKEE